MKAEMKMTGWAWKTSTYSGGGNCVETAAGQGVVRVRDTKDRDRGVVVVGGQAWTALVRSLA